MKVGLILTLIISCFDFFAQTIKSTRVDSLKFVTEVPFQGQKTDESGCGDAIFWRIVKDYKDNPSPLIDKLADTTQTLLTVPYVGGRYTIADIAHAALHEIVHPLLNAYSFGLKPDYKGCGFCTHWNFLRQDIQNRIRLQKEIREWYQLNRTNLFWVKNNFFAVTDCHKRKKHPLGGHFELPK